MAKLTSRTVQGDTPYLAIVFAKTEQQSGNQYETKQISFCDSDNWQCFGSEAGGDKDSDGVPEVAVLSSRDSDGRIVVEVKNASGATLPSAMSFAPSHTALSVQPVNDADKNSVPEIAVLSTRDSDDRILVQSRNAAGNPAPNNHWFSPQCYALASKWMTSCCMAQSYPVIRGLLTRPSQ